MTRDGQAAGGNPEAGDDAKQGPQGQQKSWAVRAQQIVGVPPKPGTERSAETVADADQPEDGAERWAGEEVRSDSTENRPARAIAQTEEAG